MRYKLHAGHGRPWHIDPDLEEYKVDEDDDWAKLKLRAQRLQETHTTGGTS